MAVAALVGTMLCLCALGMPLVFSVLGACFVTLTIFRPALPLDVMAQFFVNGMDHYALLAVAFFFLAGELMNAGGITQRLVAFANSLVGHIRGGLAHVNIVSSMLFAGISGSAVADTAAIGSVLIPSMKKAGYSAPFSAAVTEASSVVGPIIPPSIPMIVFAVLAEVSVGKMFVAGIMPGVLVGLSLMAIAYVISRRRGYPREENLSLRRVVHSGIRAAVPLVAPIIIVGGVLGGVFTATEAGAVAVAYAFVAGRFVLRELSYEDCWKALIRSAHGTATVLVIIGACTLFAWIVADLQVSQRVADIMFAISREPWIVLLMLNIFFLLVGLFIDPLPALIILVPIFFPIALEIGVDPIHFGVMIVLNLLIGLCTPPVGFLIYMSASIADTQPEKVVKESLPFLAVLVAVLLLITYVPAFTLTLPNLFFDN
ncbi:MAG: TRAP transporter large permease [Acetobacterales bacterium]